MAGKQQRDRKAQSNLPTKPKKVINNVDDTINTLDSAKETSLLNSVNNDLTDIDALKEIVEVEETIEVHIESTSGVNACVLNTTTNVVNDNNTKLMTATDTIGNAKKKRKRNILYHNPPFSSSLLWCTY